MLHITGKERKVSDNINKYLRSFAEVLDLYFEVCENCGGTGLHGAREMEEGGFSWDSGFCERCKGVGFINWKNQDVIDVCESCEGEGCKHCGNKGIVDWIQKATGVR